MFGQKCGLGQGFWKKNRLVSGKEIDSIRGQNIPSNSKTIDRTKGINIIVSHKSTDVRLKSYIRPSAVFRVGMRYARQLATYKGETRRDLKKKATYFLTWPVEAKDCRRILEWFLPLDGVHPEQEQAIERVVNTACEIGVEVHVFRVGE